LAVLARDLAFSSDGYLYAPDGNVLRRISTAGIATIAAGGGSLAAGDGGLATIARLNHPSGVAVDAKGSLYIADRDNNRIRLVTPDGTISTVPGTAGLLNTPSSVTIGQGGNLVVADTGNRRVLVFTPAGFIGGLTGGGMISPVYALSGPDGSIYIADTGAGAIFKSSPGRPIVTLLDGVESPGGLALDNASNLYFTEAAAQRVRRLTPAGDVTSIAEGVWNTPRGIALDPDGNVFVADSGLERVLRVDPAGGVTPVAGIGSPGFSGDGGPALAAELGFPWDVAVGPGGVLFVADLDNNRVRQLSPGPEDSTIGTSVVQVLNAASLQPGPVAPGMLLAFRGSGVAGVDGVTVLFGSTPGVVLAADAQQVVVQAPVSLVGLTSVQIQVNVQGNSIASIPAPIAAAAPGLFSAAANSDGTLNSPASPAPRSSIVTLYGTGEGASGLPISVTIAGAAAEVLYAGPAPGYPGLLQLNVRVPTGYFSGGDVPVLLTVGDASSQPGVTIAVQ